MNPNYVRGRALEYDVVHDYQARGWWACRMAGSHSEVDVVALKQGEVHLIQCSCKKGGKSKTDLLALQELAKENLCRAFHAYRENGVKYEEVACRYG